MMAAFFIRFHSNDMLNALFTYLNSTPMLTIA